MPELTVAQASLAITPSFAGFADAINSEAAKAGDSAGGLFSDAFNERVKTGTSDSLGSSDADAAEKGESAGGKFADSFRARVEAALAALPDIDINADSSDADIKIVAIREALEALREWNIGVDITDDEALAKVAVLKGVLDDLNHSSVSPQVKVDTAEASAQLAALKVESDETDDSLGGLGGGASGAGTGLAALGADAGASISGIGILIALIPELVGALSALTELVGGALAALPGIFAGAGAGLGALKLGLSGISGAISAYSTQQNTAAKSTAAAGESANQQASQAISNAATIRNAAASVASAEQALGNAQTAAAQSVKQANEAEITAAQQLASAQQNATDSVRSANEQLTASETSLADAQFNEKQAQVALTQARIDAANQLTNYNDQLADGALTAQQDQLNLQQAQQQLATDQASGTATPLTVASDQLNVQQATQAIQDQKDQYAQLQQAASQAAAAGVAGSTQVVGATQTLADATTAVTTAQQTQSDAAIGLSEAQQAAVQNVTNAEQQLADAQAAAAAAQVSSAQSVANAQTAVQTALQNQSDSLQQIALSAGGSGGSGGAAGATNAYAAALAKLTPAGQAFVEYVTGTLEPTFDTLKAATQQALLPGLLAGLQDLQPLFAAISPFIVQAATGIGNFATQLGQMLGSKQGVTDFTILLEEGSGFMQDLANAALTVGPAFGTIGAEAAPIVDMIGQGIEGLAQSFANWVQGGGFQNFVEWFQKNGPPIVHDIEQLVSGIVKLGIALLPVGEAFLHDLGDIGNWLGDISGGLKTVEDAITDLATWIRSHLTDILFSLLAGPFAPAVLAIEANLSTIVAFFTALPGDVATALGDFIDTAWANLKTVGAWLNTNVWTPVSTFFTAMPGKVATALGDFFTTAWANLLTVSTWLNTNVWTPVSTFFTALPGNVATAIGDFFKTAWADLTTAATWLNDEVWTPVSAFFTGIPGKVATIVVKFYDTAFADLTTIASWLETNVWTPISTFFTGLGARIATAAEHMWDGVANAFITAINDVINVWDGLKFTLPSISFLGVKIGGESFGTPNIPDIPLVGKAAGGAVDANTPYVVGELGMELFVPNQAGTILPNDLLSNLATYAPPQAIDLSTLINVGASNPSSGPLQHVDTMVIQSQADATAMAQQLSFLSRGRRL
jgi:hypothetical protein